MLAIDAFTKWPEGAALATLSSREVASWFHLHITCRFGPPEVVRVNRGPEFAGDFRKYCTAYNIHVRVINTAWARA
mgnify:FL=1